MPRRNGIPFRIVAKGQPGVKGGGEMLYYAALHHQGRFDYDDVRERVSQKSRLSRSDVNYCLTLLSEVIEEKIREGKSVDLGPLGIVSLHISSLGHKKPEDVTFRSIKSWALRFRFNKQLNFELRNLRFAKSPKKGKY